MKNNKKLWLIALPVSIALLCFGFVAYINIIAPTLYDEYPDKSNEFMFSRQQTFFSYDESPRADNLSVSQYSDVTGKHYEETVNGYKAEIYEKDEITVEKIESWLASCEPADEYYQYVYSDPDSWDMYIYYSPENGSFGGNDFKFSVDGPTVKVYVTNDGSDDTPADYILIRIQAPLRGARPNVSELYMDGVKIEKQDDAAATQIPLPAEPPSSSPEPVVYQDIDDLEFGDLSDMAFFFSSGAGAWSTEVKIMPDGTFVGLFNDSNMGESGEDYPNGTVYYCSFSGKFSSLEKTGAYEYSMKCESLVQEGNPGDEMIADGIRYIVSEPYGFDDADIFFLYLPGKNVDELPVEFLEWVGMPRVIDFKAVDILDFWGLYNVSGEQGFSW